MISLSNVIKRQSVMERGAQTIVHLQARQEEIPAVQVAQEHHLMEELEQERNQFAREVERVREQIEQERISTLELAKERGYADGFAEGRQDGREAYRERIEATNAFAGQLEMLLARQIDALEQEMLELSLAVTKQFLHETLAQDDEKLAAMIEKLLIQFRDREKLILFVHPEQYEKTLRFENRLKKILPEEIALGLRIDETLPIHDFRIESEKGAITSGIETGFASLSDKIKAVLSDG